EEATDAMLRVLFRNCWSLPRSFCRIWRFSGSRRSNAEKPAPGSAFHLPFAGLYSFGCAVPQFSAGSDSPAHQLIQHPVKSQLELFGSLVRPRGDLTPNLVDSLVPNFRQLANSVEHLTKR